MPSMQTDMSVQIADTRASDMASSTKMLLAVLNKHLTTLGRKNLKSWSDSKKKLIERLYAIEHEVAALEPQPEPAKKEPKGKKVAAEGRQVFDLDHDSAIKFIRRHRRRRSIYIRIETTVTAEGGSPYDNNSYLQCSAKQARQFVTAIIGDDHRKKMKHTIKVTADPLDVPNGSKGKLFIG